MSTFNMVVKPHPLAPYLLRSINWAQSDDPEKRYPLLGRMRYAWLTEDYKNIKILVRDSHTSWSEHKKEVQEQIKNHEGFISVEQSTFDDTHLIATFRPIFDCHYDRNLDFKKFFSLLEEIDKEMMLDDDGSPSDIPSITKDPEVLFKEILDNGISSKIQNI